MDIAGYIAAVFIGIVLGLVGGGGSILTVPVLVYLFGINALDATSYSLFVVGLTSLFGATYYIKKGLVHIKTALVFAAISIVTVFIARRYLFPAIPEHIFTAGSFEVNKNLLLLLVFAVLMVLSALSMIRKTNAQEQPQAATSINYAKVSFQGFVVGLLTGFVGAGGGFLIIPALVNFLKMHIKAAIGTSLAIIAINSLSGFAFSLPYTQVNWPFLLTLSGLAISGIFIGSYFATKMDGKKLKPMFGYFVLIMGIYILIRETLLK